MFSIAVVEQKKYSAVEETLRSAGCCFPCAGQGAERVL